MKSLFLLPFLTLSLAACSSVPYTPESSDLSPSTRGTIASTAEAPTTEPVTADEIRSGATRIVSAAEFIEFLDSLEADLDQGVPRELNVFEHRRVIAMSRELRSMLEDVESIDHLNNNQKIMIYNTTQDLWATVIGRDDDHMICHREHQIGSHFKRTRCRTLADIRREQRESYMYLRMIRGPGPMPANG